MQGVRGLLGLGISAGALSRLEAMEEVVHAEKTAGSEGVLLGVGMRLSAGLRLRLRLRLRLLLGLRLLLALSHIVKIDVALMDLRLIAGCAKGDSDRLSPAAVGAVGPRHRLLLAQRHTAEGHRLLGEAHGWLLRGQLSLLGSGGRRLRGHLGLLGPRLVVVEGLGLLDEVALAVGALDV